MVEFEGSGTQRRLRENSEEAEFHTPAECQISIDGDRITIDILSIELNQSVFTHHTLKVKLRGVGAVSAEVDFADPSNYTAYLGKTISVRIGPGEAAVDTSRQSNFIGLITEVRLESSIDGVNYVILNATSPTITMDILKKNKVFTQTDCSDLIGSIVSGYSVTQGRLDSANINTDGNDHNLEVDSKVQYQETDYDFIKRLASEYRMFAYYDGSSFHVEQAKSDRTEDLTWRLDLGKFSVGLGTGPLSYSGAVWNPQSKEKITGESSKSSIRSSLSNLSSISVNKSDAMFSTTGVSSSTKHTTQSVIDSTLARDTEGAAGKIMVCHGQSIVPTVAPGCCIRVAGMGALEGMYWIKEVKHVLEGNGQYYNTFVCTPLELAFPPVYPERQPFSHLQAGIVIDNNDPDDLGRVKVKLPWQGDDSCQFMRMMTPDGGNERGWFALPEIDDEVLVGYERGNPDMPIILGCLYNGVDRSPIPGSETLGDGVEKKVFRTKNGNEIKFVDTAGAETITISQKDGTNVLILNMDGPVISIESTGGTISLKADDINFESTSGDITIKAASNIKAESSADIELKASGNFKSEGGMNYEAKGGIGFKAEGTQAEVSGSAMTTIKGGIVKIN